MTATMPGPHLFSVVSREQAGFFRIRKDTFLLSLLGQAAILEIIIYLTTGVVRPPDIRTGVYVLANFPLVFSGFNGGGGGNHDRLPASKGSLPDSSLERQLVPPTVVVSKEPPKLTAPETVMIAPDIKLLPGVQVGDPSSLFTNWRSDGKGGPGGIGDTGCVTEWGTRLVHTSGRDRPELIPRVRRAFLSQRSSTAPSLVFPTRREKQNFRALSY
jgi:hypothetical protein